MPSCLYQRVAHALAITRETRLAFPSVFMGIQGRQTGDDTAVLMLKDDPIFRDGRGEVDWCALCAAVDAVLGAPSDMKTDARVRPATAHIELQMTGAATKGDLVVEARFVGFSEGSSVRQSLVSATIKSGDTLIGYTSAASVVLDVPEDRTRAAWPWLPERYVLEDPNPMFDANEHRALQACETAVAAATDVHPFIEHFWCGIPESNEGKAHLRLQVAPHLGNRIGHIQGGLLLGTALKAANAAAPADKRLSNISAYFVRPGVDPVLEVHSQVVQQGRRLALVRTRIVNDSGKLVLETTSQHVLR
jgi:acyl-coenzyme A thioesterase PaaI-like protein